MTSAAEIARVPADALRQWVERQAGAGTAVSNEAPDAPERLASVGGLNDASAPAVKGLLGARPQPKRSPKGRSAAAGGLLHRRK